MPTINVNKTKFLDREKEIKHKDVIEFATEGGWKNSAKYTKEDGSPSQQFEIDVKLDNGEIRCTVLNWANIKLLVTAFGEATEGWVGKKVRAWKTKSEKAKLGYIFAYVPTDWERDDTGEWIIPEKESQAPNEKVDTVEYPEGDIDPNEIPF